MTSTENKIKATATMNNEANGIEISFTGKPSASVRETMKTFGFRWHNVKSVWYAKQTPERVKFAKSLEKANDLTSDDKPSKASDKPSKANKASDKASDKASVELINRLVTDNDMLYQIITELSQAVSELTSQVNALKSDKASDKPKRTRKAKADNMSEEDKDKARTLDEAKARAKREAKRNK